ncbi:MAG: hypothetical protein HYX51_03335 [Chloroflexi bacterium]|nr:hypothetical protein [Chloroflexota bacterium]
MELHVLLVDGMLVYNHLLFLRLLRPLRVLRLYLRRHSVRLLSMGAPGQWLLSIAAGRAAV